MREWGRPAGARPHVSVNHLMIGAYLNAISGKGSASVDVTNGTTRVLHEKR